MAPGRYELFSLFSFMLFYFKEEPRQQRSGKVWTLPGQRDIHQYLQPNNDAKQNLICTVYLHLRGDARARLRACFSEPVLIFQAGP